MIGGSKLSKTIKNIKTSKIRLKPGISHGLGGFKLSKTVKKYQKHLKQTSNYKTSTYGSKDAN